ncbi:MAG: endonuclease/exonuclease/phosphatase family protein [Cyclobacteriaceae bacterium]|nr:endonuclease/exonuclease/phosphatase family protein [Cyclobacteriaceae bacterium]
MRILFCISLAIAIITGYSQAHAQDTLRLLSWNIQMLPFPAPPHGKAKRARAIASILNEQHHDVVVFQETFKRRSRRILRRELSKTFPHQTRVLNKKTFSIKTNGGVMIFSRHPIDSVHEIRFSKRTGYDKFSRKGAMLAEVNFKGKPIHVLGTHLQAFGTDDILISQYNQMKMELLDPHQRAGVPQFLLGDFNTRKVPPVSAGLSGTTPMPQTRYSAMLQTLEAEDGELHGDQQYTMDRPYNDLCTRRKEARLLLDYVLVRPEKNDLTIRREVKIFRKPWTKDHQDLSDHFALEALISF